MVLLEVASGAFFAILIAFVIIALFVLLAVFLFRVLAGPFLWIIAILVLVFLLLILL